MIWQSEIRDSTPIIAISFYAMKVENKKLWKQIAPLILKLIDPETIMNNINRYL